MATLPNIGIILPTLGADNGAWDDKLNAGLTLLDAHDHTTGKGVRVPTAGLNINADLTFGGYAATSVGKVAFSAVTALAAGSKTLFVSSSDNELYWRTNGGTNVKLTSGTTLNISLVGGIVGDYSSVGAEVAYDDANDRYTFKQQGSKPWARIASGPVRIYEFNTTESVYVELAVAAALASSYTLTLPAALPGAAALVQVSAAGVVSFSNTTTESITAADFHFTTAQTFWFSGGSFEDVAGVHTKYNSPFGAHIGWTLTNGAGKLSLPLPVREGDVITSYYIYFNKGSGVGDTLKADIYATRMFSSETEVAQAVQDTTSANAPGMITLGKTMSVTVASGWQYYLVASVAWAAGTDVLFGAALNVTRPA